MQKGLGIAALVIAIIAMFTPFLGTWLTILAGLLAAFAYGPGIGLAIASIILNIVHIFFFSPLLWVTQGLAELGAAHERADIVFVPWLLVVAQLGAGVILLMLHKYHNRLLPSPRDLSASQPLQDAGVAQRQATDHISIARDTTQQHFASSTAVTAISSESIAAEQEIPPKTAPLPKAYAAGTPTPLYLVGGLIAAGLLGYLCLSFYESKQELARMRVEKEALERNGQQEAAARWAAEQQAQAERRAGQEAAARETEAQRRAQEAAARLT